MKNSKNLTSKKTKKTQQEQIRYKGMLGGEITDGIGFGTLEQAKDWIENKFVPWNQEEAQMRLEQQQKQLKKKNKSTL